MKSTLMSSHFHSGILKGLHARGSGVGARPRVWGDERAVASGGARRREAFPARVAQEPKEKEVGVLD